MMLGAVWNFAPPFLLKFSGDSMRCHSMSRCGGIVILDMSQLQKDCPDAISDMPIVFFL